MCGRYTFYTDKELREIDEIIEQISNDIQREKMKTGEIFPTNVVPVLVPSQHEEGKENAKLLVWGFPNYAGKGVVINARSETAKEKRMFRSGMERTRCVIPSTGFFEWDQKKRKYLFQTAVDSMLYMAGISNEFDGENRFVILTTSANQSISDVHHRMPVILQRNEIQPWLYDQGAVDDILFGAHPELIRHSVEDHQLAFL